MKTMRVLLEQNNGWSYFVPITLAAPQVLTSVTKSHLNFALRSLFRCSISLFLLPQIPPTQKETPTPQLPIAAGRGEEVVRTLEKIQLGIPSTVGDRIGKTYVARVTPALFIRAPINQFSRWTTSSDPRVEPDGNSCERWDDNIWTGNNRRIAKTTSGVEIIKQLNV